MPYDPLLNPYGAGLYQMGSRYGTGDMKGKGFFGLLPNGNGMSSELSGESDGIGEYPLINPAIKREQLVRLLRGDDKIDDIYQTAEQWALARKKMGLDPFAQQNELRASPDMVIPQFK